MDSKVFSKAVQINASTLQVWRMLTVPDQMKTWMMRDVELSILTDWQVGNPIVTRGHMNGKEFENTGTVLEFVPEKVLRYSHLSSISRLPDRPESYSILEFKLQPIGMQTRLEITVSNFPTESIYKHLAFYWNVTLEVLKTEIEASGDGQISSAH
jgi:uncharacterized protein YndB with AHSA1/START domain